MRQIVFYHVDIFFYLAVLDFFLTLEETNFLRVRVKEHRSFFGKLQYVTGKIESSWSPPSPESYIFIPVDSSIPLSTILVAIVSGLDSRSQSRGR